DAAGPDSDQHLARAGLGHRDLRHLQAAELPQQRRLHAGHRVSSRGSAVLARAAGRPGTPPVLARGDDPPDPPVALGDPGEPGSPSASQISLARATTWSATASAISSARPAVASSERPYQPVSATWRKSHITG